MLEASPICKFAVAFENPVPKPFKTLIFAGAPFEKSCRNGQSRLMMFLFIFFETPVSEGRASISSQELGSLKIRICHQFLY